MRRRDLLLGLPLAVSGVTIRPAGMRATPAPPATGTVELVPARMSARRAGHSATLLGDGRVLVIGGFVDEQMRLSSLEAYAPDSGRWTPLGDLAGPRHSHTATALADGRILVAGGYADDSLETVELFSPADGSVMSLAPMTTARSGHQAVMLATGQVLVIGGVGTDWAFLASAELFDHDSRTFAQTGEMAVSRESHTATLLTDDRVLIVGGHTGRRADLQIHSSAEIYDPATGLFEPGGEMTVPRHKHDAVALPDGRVLIVGGTDERDGDGIYHSTEYWDPMSGTFASGPDLLTPRYKHQGTTVVLADGRILIAGGAGTVEILDPVTDEFTLVSGDLSSTRLFATATLTNAGTILITGGYDDTVTASDRCWLYRPA